MALTAQQIHRRDAQRRSLAVPPDPDPAPPVTSRPVGVYVQKDQPTDVAAGSVWIPLNPDGTAMSAEHWQVYT